MSRYLSLADQMRADATADLRGALITFEGFSFPCRPTAQDDIEELDRLYVAFQRAETGEENAELCAREAEIRARQRARAAS